MERGEELQVQSARFPLLRFRRSSSFQSAKKERKREEEPRSLFSPSNALADGRSVGRFGLRSGSEGDEIRARRTSYLVYTRSRSSCPEVRFQRGKPHRNVKSELPSLYSIDRDGKKKSHRLRELVSTL